MSDLMGIIKGRRAVRKYKEKDVPEESLNRILESVRWAPSWNNTQCWEVIVVRDSAIKEKLQEVTPKINPAWKVMGKAPVVLALCGKTQTSGFYADQALTKFGDWFMFDLGLASQNLCLTAYDLGLGTVIAGVFDHNRAKEILDVPEGYEVLTLIPLGYPAHEPSPPQRREIGEFAHYDRFQ